MLPLLLFAGFRTLIDRMHAELAKQGHPDLRPAYGFAMQAVGLHGATAGEVAGRLGISKQAAGKTIDRLTALGYATRAQDPADARRKLIHLTPHGLDCLSRSVAIFDRLRTEWITALGEQRLEEMEDGLHAVIPAEAFRLDIAGWLG